MSPHRPLALVTGASSGIGVDFADELAQRGYDLAIAARRVEQLNQVAQDLQSRHGVRVDVIESDLGQPDGAERLFEEAMQLQRPVEVLVNNAGVGTFGRFLGQSLEDVLAMIQVNLRSLTVLTRLFAGEMRKNGGGKILNNASFSAIQPAPRYAVYSATKSYVLTLSLALNRDLRKDKIQVTALAPGFFDSDFLEKSGQRESRILQAITLDRRQVARAGIRGLMRGKAVVVPGVVYKLTDLSLRFVPRIVGLIVTEKIVKP